ncbi:MAG: hypothetical protein JXB26_19785 [Candidatus Aminicenantes bacterium]|nr:hypothetical protein [Candidatus Aminicenantes bacterium]
MKKIFPLLFLCVTSLSAQQEGILNRGRNPFPCFDRSGVLIIAFESEQGGIATKRFWNSLEKPGVLLAGVSSYGPVLKKDPEQNIWAAWTQGREEGTQVYIARFENETVNTPLNPSQGLPGNNHSPSLSFGPDGSAWVAWINDRENESLVLVWNQTENNIREIFTLSGFRNSSPKIAVSASGLPWVFWACTLRDQPEIFCSRFDGNAWSQAASLNASGHFPHICPEAALDPYGWPWVVWSEYDGKDYEIAVSFWDGRKWSRGSFLTRDADRTDSQPFICFLQDGTPMVAWIKSGEKNCIAGSLYTNGKWSSEILLAEEWGSNRFPRIAVERERLALVWENLSEGGNAVYYKVFSQDQLSSKISKESRRFLNVTSHEERAASTDVLPYPGLAQDEYLAVGDSITYGVLARTWYPDKGYVPRLERILSGLYGPVKVLNRGIPGEFTWEGLARLEQTIKEDSAKFALIMEGTNDMRTDVPVETSAFNITKMIETCISFGVYPFIGTIIHRSDILWEYGVKERTLLFNTLLRSSVPEYSVPLIDHFQNFDTYPAGYLALFSDGAHPNEDGYQLIAEAWAEAVRCLPRPPVNINICRETNQILFYDEPVNVLTWDPHPDTDPSVSIESYIIFRKKYGHPVTEFAQIAEVSGNTFLYYDRDIQPDDIYEYCFIAQSNDGIKGPASSGVADH